MESSFQMGRKVVFEGPQNRSKSVHSEVFIYEKMSQGWSEYNKNKREYNATGVAENPPTKKKLKKVCFESTL